MPDLKNKTILILSPQSWGKMFVSKHHYAIELAKRGNKVYFLNPPDQGGFNRSRPIEITQSGVHPNLYLIGHALPFPYQLKFHALPLFHWLMKFHIRKLVLILGSIDIVWSFDLGNLYPFRLFGSGAYKIFHPVDEPLNKTAIDAAKGADILFSVTREILEKYASFKGPKHFINHGVTNDFILSKPKDEIGQPIKVGFAGNLLRSDIDREALLEIVDKNSNCVFEFWGSYTMLQGNIGGTEDESLRIFIGRLQSFSNVILHGAVSSSSLASELSRMDVLLICYDVQKDQSKGTNYHKVMEYLAIGKVIVSNNITTYNNQPSLVQMVSSRVNNDQLPDLFKQVTNNLLHYNSIEECSKRRQFALNNTYLRQVERIELLTQQ